MVNEAGHRVAVLLDLASYQALLDALEELECIRAYDAAKAAGDEAVPLADALAEIERRRSCRTSSR